MRAHARMCLCVYVCVHEHASAHLQRAQPLVSAAVAKLWPVTWLQARGQLIQVPASEPVHTCNVERRPCWPCCPWCAVLAASVQLAQCCAVRRWVCQVR